MEVDSTGLNLLICFCAESFAKASTPMAGKQKRYARQSLLVLVTDLGPAQRSYQTAENGTSKELQNKTLRNEKEH